jgi:hypothetical protein
LAVQPQKPDRYREPEILRFPDVAPASRGSPKALYTPLTYGHSSFSIANNLWQITAAE